jgi:hypothetical protein
MVNPWLAAWREDLLNAQGGASGDQRALSNLSSDLEALETRIENAFARVQAVDIDRQAEMDVLAKEIVKLKKEVADGLQAFQAIVMQLQGVVKSRQADDSRLSLIQAQFRNLQRRLNQLEAESDGPVNKNVVRRLEDLEKRILEEDERSDSEYEEEPEPSTPSTVAPQTPMRMPNDQRRSFSKELIRELEQKQEDDKLSKAYTNFELSSTDEYDIAIRGLALLLGKTDDERERVIIRKILKSGTPANTIFEIVQNGTDEEKRVLSALIVQVMQ